MHVIQLIINGILLGGIYAVLGVGMTMIFGIVKLTNLAHGEFVILGAYGSTLLAQALGVDPILTLIVTVPCMFLIGMGLQTGLINRVMLKGSEPALLVTFGLSIILQDAMLLLFTADARHAGAAYSSTILKIGGINIALLDIILLVISLVTILILTMFLNKTYMGRSIRATSDDTQAASLMGVSVKRTYGIAMGIAMATAAVAGLCIALKWTYYPSSGGGYLLPPEQTPEGAGEIRVLIGPENVAEELKDSSVVIATYDAGDNTKGMIGVVGPTRMDYSTVAAKLSILAAGLSRRLGSGEAPPEGLHNKLIIKGDKNE